MKTGNDICAKALEIIQSGEYVYWYGGKGEKCTESLLSILSRLHPSIYTASYIKRCKQDIKNGKKCIDCSGLVSMAYGFPGEGTYGIYHHAGITQCYEEPRNGMILWKHSHTGIYFDGKVLESRSQRYGLTSTRKYNRKDWTATLQSVDVNYNDKREQDLKKIAKDVISGKYGNGAKRKTMLKALGLTDAQVKEVQSIVNNILKGKR